MTIDEVIKPDPLKAQMDAVKRDEKVLKLKKANLKSQKAQSDLRTARAASAAPLS